MKLVHRYQTRHMAATIQPTGYEQPTSPAISIGPFFYVHGEFGRAAGILIGGKQGRVLHVEWSHI